MSRARLTWLWCSVMLAASWPSLAAAQGGPRVSVLRVDPAHEWIARDLESALAGVQVVRDPGYLAEADRRGLDPASEAAFATLIPLVGVDLVLVPRSVELDALGLEFRDGQSGQSLGRVEVPLSSGTLGSAGRAVVLAETNARLANRLPVAGDVPLDAAEDTGSVDEESAQDAASDASDAPALEVSLALGAGVGSRTVEWSVVAGSEKVDTGAFPAMGARVAIDVVTDPGFSIGPALEYQTSIGHDVTERHIGGEPYPMGIRSHHFEGAIVPTWRLGASRRLRVWAALGYAVRDLQPEVHHLLIPSFSLSGPVLRVGVRIPIVAETVEIVVAPEAQWIALVGEDLEERDVNASGWGLGAHGALEVGVGGGFFVALTLREAHVFLGSSRGEGATDVERYATLGVVREL